MKAVLTVNNVFGVQFKCITGKFVDGVYDPSAKLFLLEQNLITAQDNLAYYYFGERLSFFRRVWRTNKTERRLKRELLEAMIKLNEYKIQLKKRKK